VRLVENTGERAPTARDYLNILRRRKWIAVTAVVLVPLVAVGLALHQQSAYRASADVLLSQENLVAELTGTPTVSGSEDPATFAQTQVDLAQTPEVGRLVLKAAHVQGSPSSFFANASISSNSTSDILTFSVTNHVPALAVRLANAYARTFTAYRRHLDTAAIQEARKALEKRMKQLQASGNGDSALYQNLSERDLTLATMATLESANIAVVRVAGGAMQVEPQPRKYAIIGLLIGIVLGVGAALLWETLDTRVRSAEEVSGKLHAPLLARLPTPSRKLRSADSLAMLDDPDGVQAEAVRMLRTNLDFVRLERNARTVMITSAIEQEGKSTTVANLAIAVARSGQHVALVDLDLRRPYIDHFFHLEQRPGIAQVALGLVDLEQAIVPIPLGLSAPGPGATNGHGNGNENGNGAANGNGSANGGSSANGSSAVWNAKHDRPGLLEVLTAGAIPPDTGDFVGKEAVREILGALAERTDLVLVDAPPLLRVGDGLILSSRVDALLVVARANVLRRGMLNELGRVLENLPVSPLGVVLTGADAESSAYYRSSGYYRYYAPRSEREKSRVLSTRR